MAAVLHADTESFFPDKNCVRPASKQSRIWRTQRKFVLHLSLFGGGVVIWLKEGRRT